MPRFRILVQDDYDTQPDPATAVQEWELPYEQLVFDQRFDHRLPDQEEPGRWVVRKVLPAACFVVAPNPGTRQGGDPKKARVD